MKKKEKRNNGYVLILVITLLSMIGVSLTLMSAGFRSMSFHTNQQNLNRCLDNLVMSAYTWAEYNQIGINESVKLDASFMNFPSELELTRTGPNEIDITASCRSGKQIRSTQTSIAMNNQSE